jgi:multicomponent K+:H+ antiporter subunit D
VQAAAVMNFTQATANALHAPGTYVRAVMEAAPIAAPLVKEAP